MFLIKERKYPIIDSTYQLSNYGELLNNTFDGGEQLFLDKNCRHIFIDLNKETFECYSICVILNACSFSVADFNLKDYTDISLYYKKSDNLTKIYICEDFELNYYVDYKNKLILIGDISADGKCYQFFKDTFCVLSDNKIELLIVKVEDEILNHLCLKR